MEEEEEEEEEEVEDITVVVDLTIHDLVLQVVVVVEATITIDQDINTGIVLQVERNNNNNVVLDHHHQPAAQGVHKDTNVASLLEVVVVQFQVQDLLVVVRHPQEWVVEIRNNLF